MSRGTPTTPFRIDPTLKARAQARATREGTTLTAIVVAALETYADDEPDPTPTGDEPTEPTDVVTPLPPDTQVRVTWPRSTHYGRRGVIEAQVADRYRIEVDGGGGTFLRQHEFEVLGERDALDAVRTGVAESRARTRGHLDCCAATMRHFHSGAP